MLPPQRWVWLARIRKPQGRKGEVLAELLTDFPDKFKERKRVWLLKADDAASTAAAVEAAPGGAAANEAALGVLREAEIADFFLHKGGVVLRFAGVGSIPEAEALRGLVVAVPLAERVELAEDEVYVGDLIGCLLVDVGVEPSRTIGVIEDVERDAGPVALLVVAGDGGGEILVPFAKEYLRLIDFAGRRVEMALPEGLIEVQVDG